MNSTDDRLSDEASKWAWALTVAVRLALCLLGVVLIAAGGIGFALGRWWFG